MHVLGVLGLVVPPIQGVPSVALLPTQAPEVLQVEGPGVAVEVLGESERTVVGVPAGVRGGRGRGGGDQRGT
jgi:hypothetical protein